MSRVWYRWNLSNLGRQDSYPRLPVSSALETLQATVNYSNLPHSQDYLARENEHAIDVIEMRMRLSLSPCPLLNCFKFLQTFGIISATFLMNSLSLLRDLCSSSPLYIPCKMKYIKQHSAAFAFQFLTNHDILIFIASLSFFSFSTESTRK